MPNKLIQETSPYLLQHAHNPVDWYPWGEEAFAKAKAEDKLVLVSIGYSACHWCHVMEKESFENAEIAVLMNENFVCIKVDREERPDVDQVYMGAVQLISGSGGWPLNCFALPDKSPIYGGTYYPPKHWKEILKGLVTTWHTDREKVLKAAHELTEGVANTEIIKERVQVSDFSIRDLRLVVEPWKRKFDKINGGWGAAPKFPMPPALEFLLDYAWLSDDQVVRSSLFLTLKKLASGGIYDHLGGGFFRYSVDKEWIVPHFEKMLYDNAQLAIVYAKAFVYYGYADFARVAKETLQFALRDLWSENGGFYSAIDADSDGAEGKFYLWTNEELKELAGDDYQILSQLLLLKSNEHLKEGSVLVRNENYHTSQLLPEEVTRLNLLVQTLYQKRLTRKKPSLDIKQIASWNGLLLKALSEVSRYLEDPGMQCFAESNAHFIEDFLVANQGRLSRCYTSGHASEVSFLDDYAFVADGYVSLYQTSLDEKWLLLAKKLVDLAIELFYDEASGMFFYTSKDLPAVVSRKMELTDGVMPAAASTLGHVLLSLGQYFHNEQYCQISRQMVYNLKMQLSGAGPYTANWARLYLRHLFQPVVVAVADELNEGDFSRLNSFYYPPMIFAASATIGQLPVLQQEHFASQNKIFVCHGKSCFKPVLSVDELLDTLNSIKEKAVH
ncbi:MAG TPA: thioredoxin domain-containing protein [Williamwhitmania sp.]|nr:thioredoxin domain-containing protein [Williamwhitmania sp.]